VRSLALRPNLSALLQRGRQGTRSIRFKITFKIWLLLLAVFSLTNLAVNVLAARIVLERGHLYLGATSKILGFGIENWLDDIQVKLKFDAGLPAFRSLDPQQIQPELERLARLYPYREWRVWKPNGTLLAYTGKMDNRAQAERRIIQSKHFQAALSGVVSYGAVHSSSMIGEDCLAYAVPIYRQGALPAMAGRTADGLLSFCLPLTELKKDSSLDRLSRELKSSSVQVGSGELTFDGVSQYLIGDNGVVIHLLGPHLDQNRSVGHGQSIAKGSEEDRDFEAGGFFGGLTAAAVQPSSLRRWSWQGVELLSFSTPIKGNWRLVTLLTEAQLFLSLRVALAFLVKLQIVALVLISLSLYVSCSRLLSPLKFVAQALRRFRDGQFQVCLPEHKADEMGVLLEDLRETGLQLDDLLQQQAMLVRRDLQIETARRIQGDFLVRVLPQDPRFDVAACSIPALDVGADWYDAMTFADLTLIVVADVCDKGVGSALYMSVFRTLIRYGMQHALAEGVEEKPLSKVLGLVNDYMIGNHAGSAMFATAFVALFNAKTGALDYVLAGHEPPLVKHRDGLLKLEECGPALGLFPATFVARHHQLEPGDLLFAYSDGLVDARSIDDASFGIQRVEQLLLELPTDQLGAQGTLDVMVAHAREHIGEADQFDDLTVMTLLLRSELDSVES
jgi:sigma-B regulation protein RsbU (phosphoserine phosphatase)